MAFSRPKWLSQSGACQLLLFVCGVGFGSGTALAQSPMEPPQIEVWEGLKKVSGSPTTPAPQPTPQPTPVPVPVETAQPMTPVAVPPPPPPLDPNIFRDLRNSQPPEMAPPIMVTPPLPTSMKPTEDAVPVADLMTNLNRSRQQVMLALAWAGDFAALFTNLGESLASFVQPVGDVFIEEEPTRLASQTTATVPEATTPAESSSLAAKLMAPEMLFYAGVLVISPLMFLLGLVIVLKRAGVLSSPVVRIEVIGGGVGSSARHEPEPSEAHVEQGLPMANEATPIRKRDEDLLGLLPPDDYEPQSFDIGPSFEEERIAKEELLENQATALLQQVFEQNIRLQQQPPAQPPVEAALALAEEIDSEEESAQPTQAAEEETTV